MYDYLTDYIIDFYEEQDGEPIDTPDDGVDPVILKRLEYDLFDVDRMKKRWISFQRVTTGMITTARSTLYTIRSSTR